MMKSERRESERREKDKLVGVGERWRLQDAKGGTSRFVR